MCKYEGCKNTIKSQDDNYCIFHAPKDKKGISDRDFLKLIESKVDIEDYNFEGYIFHIALNFHRMEFKKDVNFKNAKFQGKISAGQFDNTCVIFSEAKFGYGVYFINAEFSGGNVYFEKAEFWGNAYFNSAKFTGGNYYFHETKFHKGDANFGGVEFYGESVLFNNSEFLDGNVMFIGVKFKVKNIEFTEIKFTGGSVNFSNAEFFAERVSFNGTEFSKGIAFFRKSKFVSDKVDFSYTVFYGQFIDFQEAIFNVKFVDFEGAEFLGGNVIFSNVEFSGGNVNFNGATFSKNVYFYDNKIKHNLNFSEIKLDNNSEFYFINPIFLDSEEKIIIKFKNVNFNPKTYFRRINLNKNTKPKKREYCIDVIIIFRYCQLKDVDFTDVDISLLSFYKSTYEDSRYNACKWMLEKRIAEERIYDYVNNLKGKNKQQNKNINYEIEDLDYNEISNLYRKFKTLLDNKKDYTEAGKFYFNECEMKRKYFVESLKKIKFLEKIKNIGYYCIYSLYKFFMGYGERAGKTFIWFIFLTLLLSVFHLMNGLIVQNNVVINYDLKIDGIKNFYSLGFWKDILYSLNFTISRIIPISYFPSQRFTVTAEGLDGLLLSVLDSIVLILFIIFIGTGLKRHFRRF